MSQWISTGLILTTLAVGCAQSVDTSDELDGPDAATPQEGAADATPPRADAAPGLDATTLAPDGSIADATAADVAADAGTPDVVTPADAAAPDAAIADASMPDTSTPLDGGHDAGTDAGSCAPVLTGFTPATHAATRSPGACSAAQIQGYYDGCLGAAATTSACATWQATASATCPPCLTGSSDPGGATWGPIVRYARTIANNQGGCLALDQPGEAACARDLQASTECRHAACDSACTGATKADYDACVAAAQGGVCKAYVDSVNADCAGVTSTCFGGADFQANFKLVAAEFCQ